MEEILASIRRIISEDETGPLTAEAPDPAPGDDVFELTQEIRDDGTVVDITTGAAIHAHDAPEPVAVEHGEEADPAESAPAASTASFETFAQAAAGERVEADIGGRTVEDVVEDVVRPIVREWLDENLPRLVERMIGREIDLRTRRAEDGADC